MRKLKGNAGGMEACSGCGQPLAEVPWSKPGPGQRMYILACDNLGCPRYRNPVRTVTKGAK